MSKDIERFDQLKNNLGKEPEIGEIWATNEPGFMLSGRKVLILRSLPLGLFQVVPISFDVAFAGEDDIIKLKEPQYMFETWNTTYCHKSALNHWWKDVPGNLLEKIHVYIENHQNPEEFEYEGYEALNEVHDLVFEANEQNSILYFLEGIKQAIAHVIISTELLIYFQHRLRKVKTLPRIYRGKPRELVQSLDYQTPHGVVTINMYLDSDKEKIYLSFSVEKKSKEFTVYIEDQDEKQLDIIDVADGIGKSRIGLKHGLYILKVEYPDVIEPDTIIINVE